MKMEYRFTCYGHENITSKHKNTLEFTKDNDVSLQGDCIVGVKADFSLVKIRKFIKSKLKDSQYKAKLNNRKKQLKNNSINKEKINEKTIKKIPIKIIIEIKNLKEEVNGFLNPDFDDSQEIVIRKSDFVSERTLVVNADNAACDLNEKFKGKLNDPNTNIEVRLI